MAKRTKCPKCGDYNAAEAAECEKCGVLFRDIKGPSVNGAGTYGMKAPHDANPNERYCKCGCGKGASIFPGVLKGGGEGWASGCYRPIDSVGMTETGSEAVKELQTLLKVTRERYERSMIRKAAPLPSRVPGEDDE